MALIRIVDTWLRSPASPPVHQRAIMVVAEKWAEQRVLMRAFADSPDQTRPTIVLHGTQLAIGPASTDPHGSWGIHVEPPIDGRAQELREQLQIAAKRLAGSKGNPPLLADESSSFERKRTNNWAPGTPPDIPGAHDVAASYHDPSRFAMPQARNLAPPGAPPGPPISSPPMNAPPGPPISSPPMNAPPGPPIGSPPGPPMSSPPISSPPGPPISSSPNAATVAPFGPGGPPSPQPASVPHAAGVWQAVGVDPGPPPAAPVPAPAAPVPAPAASPPAASPPAALAPNPAYRGHGRLRQTPFPAPVAGQQRGWSSPVQAVPPMRDQVRNAPGSPARGARTQMYQPRRRAKSITAQGFAAGEGAAMANRGTPAQHAPKRRFASMVNKTMPVGFQLTAPERQVLDAIAEQGSLTAREITALTGASNGAAWMAQLMTKLASYGLDLVAIGPPADGEPQFILKT